MTPLEDLAKVAYRGFCKERLRLISEIREINDRFLSGGEWMSHRRPEEEPEALPEWEKLTATEMWHWMAAANEVVKHLKEQAT